ncbi:MAG: ATP-binding protein [Proteobacteria bacterium]|nr:ATP-binding protein [Pseudomonadota bacterium]
MGKTYSVTEFGKTEFDNVVVVNFEEKPDIGKCFSDFDTKGIIDKLSVLTRSDIRPGHTLLFLDEIQECPKAISSLRYFYEKMPELHVVGAGSLIEFALRSENFRMPVGRIQSIFMHPLSFEEFLQALGEDKLVEFIYSVELSSRIHDGFAKRLEQLLRQYLLVGGMPAAVKAFANGIALNDIQHLQNGIFRTFADDFSKYATTAKHKYLREVYTSAPKMAGQRYKYSHINPNIESKFLKDALELLCSSRCITKVCHTSGSGSPLQASVNERKFKIIFLDVGLMQNALGAQASLIHDQPILQTNAGNIAEQFVGQEHQAYGDPYHDPGLFFWARDARSSSAEVDYLIDIEGRPVPVEVKAGATGSLKSMRFFLDSYTGSPVGLRYSMHDLSFCDNILSIPLYMINQTHRLFKNCLQLKG